MLDAEDILNGLVRGALSGRRKSWTRAGRAFRGSGLVNAHTLLAAAGVAWGLFETWQSQQAAGGGPPGRAGGRRPRPAAPPLPPAASAAPAPDEDGLPAPVAAAAAAHDLGGPRRRRARARRARAHPRRGPRGRRGGARPAGARRAAPLGEIVAGVTDPELKEQLYTLAFVIVRADESVTGGERIYLAQLANRLGLDAATCRAPRGEAAARIDAAHRRGQSRRDEGETWRRQWFMAIGGQQVGPVTEQDVVNAIKSGSADATTLVFAPAWRTGRRCARCRSSSRTSRPTRAAAAPGGAAAPSGPARPRDRLRDLRRGDAVRRDRARPRRERRRRGRRVDVHDRRHPDGDDLRRRQRPEPGKGFMGTLLGAGKRLLTGESLFMTVFTAQGRQARAGRVRRALPRQDPGRWT